MKLIVGLGNPGKEYDNTPHNVGFSLIDYICNNKNIDLTKKQFNAIYGVTKIDDEKIMLIKPLSYMNLSGDVVRKYVDYFKVSIDDILIIQDDLDLSLGRVKIVKNSSSGGHNGIKDIEKKLNTNDYMRLKIGIGNNCLYDARDYVLSKFSLNDQKKLLLVYEKLNNILEDFCLLSLEQMKNKYNKHKGIIEG